MQNAHVKCILVIVKPPSSSFSVRNFQKSSETLSELEQRDTLSVAIFIRKNSYTRPLHPRQSSSQPKRPFTEAFHIHVIYSIYDPRVDHQGRRYYE